MSSACRYLEGPAKQFNIELHQKSLQNGNIISDSNGLSAAHKKHVVANGKIDTQGRPLLARWIHLLVPTLRKDDVPLLFREPHVEGGFRALHQPWAYYLCSTLQLHNESMNVWTHMLAWFLIMRKFVLFSSSVDFIGDPHTWPLLSGLVCGLALYAFSSGAHCLQSKSQFVHYIAFMVDYAGIGLYGLGSVIVHLAYCSEDGFYYATKDFFVPLGGVFATMICYCCAVAKVIYKRPYPFRRKMWQIVPVVSVYIVLISPIVHRLWTCFVYGEDCNKSIPYHIEQVFWFIASGLFFASDFPQRLKPGFFDHFFHSHQLFHLSIMICTLRQMDGAFIDLETRHDTIYSRPDPTFASAFGPVIMVVMMELICIVYFASRLYPLLYPKSKQSNLKEADLKQF